MELGISQFADDTTLFMEYNERKLRGCMDILSLSIILTKNSNVRKR